MAAPKKNKFYLLAKLKENNGRPRLYNTPEELLEEAYNYFDASEKNDGGKVTMSGLRLWLGMTPSNWRDYKQNQDFSHAVLYLTEILKDFYEKKLAWAGSFAGGQYWLKCQGGDEWQDVDKKQIDFSGKIETKFGNTIHTTQDTSEDTQ